MRTLATLLLENERRGKKSGEAGAPSAVAVNNKLRSKLMALMGAAGYHALLSRALALTVPKIPWLHGVQANADGTLKGLEDLCAQLSPEDFSEGGVALVAQLLRLLTAFVGESLTVRLVREVWPKLPSPTSISVKPHNVT